MAVVREPLASRGAESLFGADADGSVLMALAATSDLTGGRRPYHRPLLDWPIDQCGEHAEGD